MADKQYIIKGPELAGFDLAAYITKGGYKMQGSEQVLKQPPTEVTLCGNTYTLEYITIGSETLYNPLTNSLEGAKMAWREKCRVPNDADVFCNLGYV